MSYSRKNSLLFIRVSNQLNIELYHFLQAIHIDPLVSTMQSGKIFGSKPYGHKAINVLANFLIVLCVRASYQQNWRYDSFRENLCNSVLE